jgi:Domain of unknown function (DUF4397)
MKYIIIFFLSFLLLNACKKNDSTKPGEIFNTGQSAYLKVYNATLSSARNYLYVDNNLYTGSLIGYGGTFPASTTYATVPTGTKSVSFKDTMTGTFQAPIGFSKNFEAGKYYSLITYDTVGSIKYLVTEDNLTQPTDTSSRLRFANLSFSTVPVPNIDIYSQRLNKNIFTDVAPGTVTGFINHLSRTPGDTLYPRATGTTANLTTALIFTPGQQRSYTIIFRGRYQSTSGTVTRNLTFYTNY